MTPLPCPECGALPANSESCRDRFDLCLALELTDPAYGVVHHLTVPAYYLQHPSLLSVKGWVNMRDLLGQFLNEGMNTANARIRVGLEMDSDTRDWSLVSGAPLQLPNAFTWQATIPTINPDDSTGYPAAIAAWAQAVLTDSAVISAPA